VKIALYRLILVKMDTIQVQNYFQNNQFSKNIFKGVIPVDYLENEPITKPSAYVVNTGKSDTSGEHWFALLIPRFGPIEYFDSYGKNLSTKK